MMLSEILKHINWLAVFAAAVAYFMLGAIWYTTLFGKQWRAYNSTLLASPDAKKDAAGIMLLSFILMAVCSFGLALIATRLFLTGWLVGLKLGLVTGIFFAATAVHISLLYEKRPLGVHLINGLFNVAGNIMAAMIICSWR